jgi:hypothetical protein
MFFVFLVAFNLSNHTTNERKWRETSSSFSLPSPPSNSTDNDFSWMKDRTNERVREGVRERIEYFHFQQNGED